MKAHKNDHNVHWNSLNKHHSFVYNNISIDRRKFKEERIKFHSDDSITSPTYSMYRKKEEERNKIINWKWIYWKNLREQFLMSRNVNKNVYWEIFSSFDSSAYSQVSSILFLIPLIADNVYVLLHLEYCFILNKEEIFSLRSICF